MIRFIHTADIHYSKENRQSAFKSLEKLFDSAREKRAELILISGDLSDRAVQNTEASGLPDLQKMIMDVMFDKGFDTCVPCLLLDGFYFHP